MIGNTEFNKHSCDCIAILNKEEFDEDIWYPSYYYLKSMYIETLYKSDSETLDRPIWDKFNEEFNLMIDYYEEETLENKYLKRAKEILADFLKDNITQVQRATAEKVLCVVQKAIDCDTFVEFEF